MEADIYPLCKDWLHGDAEMSPSVSATLILPTGLPHFIHLCVPLPFKSTHTGWECLIMFFSGFTLILCLPDFKNNLVQPQSIRPLHLYLLFCLCPLCPPFDFLLHCGPSKKIDCTISVVLAGVVSVFLSRDWSVCVCMYVCVFFPLGIWDRGSEPTWRARWRPWTRVCSWSSSWLRRGCCFGGRNRYTVQPVRLYFDTFGMFP